MSLTFLPISAVYSTNLSTSALSAFVAIAVLLVSIAALLASISLRLSSTASAASPKPFVKPTMSCSTVAIASLVESPNSVTVSPISLTFLPISAVYSTNLSTSALSAFVAIAVLLVSIAALLAFTSALMVLTTSAVFTNASLFSLTVSVKSPNASSCAATTSFKPSPLNSSASTSSLVASRTVLLPLASVVMKFEPDAKPLMVCSNSKVFKSRASLSFLKVSLPVSLSYVVPSPKTVKNAA